MKVIQILSIIVLTSKLGISQKIIKGMVIDSASLYPISDVNIVIRNTNHGTFTNDEGKFTLIISDNDTIDFTRVGYYSESLEARNIPTEFNLKMREKATVLRPVTLTSKIEIPKLEIPKETIWKHPHIDVGNGIVNVFGPGVTIPFYKIFKNKEKNKTRELLRDAERSKTYIAIITNPETKQNLMVKYNLSEKEYYDTLTTFNETNSDIMYALTEIELITFLDNFFLKNTPK